MLVSSKNNLSLCPLWFYSSLVRIRFLLFIFFIPSFAFSEIKVVLVGDSNTHGIPAKEYGWAYLLEKDFEGRDIKFYNYAIGLATTNQCEQLLNIVLEIHKPDIVIYTAGLVDVLFKHPLNEMKMHMKNSIKLCQEYNAAVLFGVIDFSCWADKHNFHPIYLAQSNSVFLDITLKCPVIGFEYLNTQVLGDGEFNIGDWVHPNYEGNVIIHRRVKEKFLEVLAKIHKPY